eukprot:1159715-Pelagomonas_calceolata.AAC.2
MQHISLPRACVLVFVIPVRVRLSACRSTDLCARLEKPQGPPEGSGAYLILSKANSSKKASVLEFAHIDAHTQLVRTVLKGLTSAANHAVRVAAGANGNLSSVLVVQCAPGILQK